MHFLSVVLGCVKKGGDLEVCYINETILEEEDEEGGDKEHDQPVAEEVLEEEEEEEEEEQYEYEEDYRSTLASIPRSKTDWEVFKALDDSVEEQPYSSASPPSRYRQCL